MSDYPMLISNKLHSFRNFMMQTYTFYVNYNTSRPFFLIFPLSPCLLQII